MVDTNMLDTMGLDKLTNLQEFKIRLGIQKFTQISTFMNNLPINTVKKIEVELIRNIYLADIDNVFIAIYRLINLEDITVKLELE